MTDPEIQRYLADNGYPEHIVREGRAGLVRRWKTFVEQVERGYSFGMESYRNDLDVRAILMLADAEDDEVRALDERFKKLLIGTDKRVWESAGGEPFWDFGYPKNAGHDMVADLKREGLLDPG